MTKPKVISTEDQNKFVFQNNPLVRKLSDINKGLA